MPASSGKAPAGNKPEDFKVRAELNAQRQRQDKPADSAAQANSEAKANNAAAKPKKLAAADNSPPGTVVSAKDLAEKKEHFETGYLWTADGNFVRPIRVKIIATDGTMTEVREAKNGTNLKEDLEIVTGENVASESDDTTNPFAPKIFRGK